jgi:hypothetical protein
VDARSGGCHGEGVRLILVDGLNGLAGAVYFQSNDWDTGRKRVARDAGLLLDLLKHAVDGGLEAGIAVMRCTYREGGYPRQAAFGGGEMCGLREERVIERLRGEERGHQESAGEDECSGQGVVCSAERLYRELYRHGAFRGFYLRSPSTLVIPQVLIDFLNLVLDLLDLAGG